MEKKEKPESRVGRTIGIGFICFVLIIGFAIWVPGLIGFRSKGICSRVEVDAQEIAAALSDYLSASEDHDLTLTKEDIERLVDLENPWTLTRCGNNFYINVIDRTVKCPAKYQNSYSEWNSSIYTFIMD